LTAIVDQNLLDAFHRCLNDPDTDEAGLAALVARVLDPSLDAEVIEADLQALAQGCPTGETPWRYLERQGFAGNAADYGSLDNSNLARVLDTRRGIPITLGVVLMQVARVGGRAAVGINFPGHFIVQVEDLLVDPFIMQPLERERLVERLPAAARRLSGEALFAPASAVTVGLRMLNNIKLAYSRRAAWHQTLEVIDAQLRLAPQQPALHLERGDVWQHLGLVAPAKESFQRALAVAQADASNAAEQVRRAARKRLEGLGGSGDVVH
jgi:regulator of sirC expression with transglutaminase-like and TPR domain